MAKSGMKKSKVHARTQRSIEFEQEKLAEEQAAKDEIANRKRRKRQTMSVTIELMLGMYSLVFAIISWLVDWMGIIALISVIIGFIGVRKLQYKKDKYYYFALVGLVLGGIRLLWEVISFIIYLL